MFDLLPAKVRARRSGPSRAAYCVLLLALSAALCGCGLGQRAYLSSRAEKEAERIPETGSRADIMRAAAEHPDAALLSPAFYREATPDDVGRALQVVDPTRLKHSKVEVRKLSGGGGGGGGGWNDIGYGTVLAAVGMGTLLPVYEMKSYTVNPVPTALEHSRHPEVIAMLGNAGCKMTGWIGFYISRYKSYNGNPETLALLLSYEPDPVQSASILNDIVHGSDRRFPPEALRVFLDKARRGRKVLKEDDWYHAYAAKAVESGSLEKLRMVLEGGASPDEPWLDDSPIVLAYKAGRQDMVEALLAAGAKDEKPVRRP
ncbi:hypothetical protein LJC15_05370 [Desulfovibrio sp. OttesenSCG-928-G11]|nr:hypothetical protein [Desulfovibrio sp. OttesenSCG-928-G11]